MAKRFARHGGVLVTALLLLCFCAVACLPHATHHSLGQSCAICHAGQLPFLEPGLSAAFAVLFLVVWFHGSTGLSIPRDAILAACSSRAPPE